MYICLYKYIYIYIYVYIYIYIYTYIHMYIYESQNISVSEFPLIYTFGMFGSPQLHFLQFLGKSLILNFPKM